MIIQIKHCVKSVQIRSFSGPYLQGKSPYSVLIQENTDQKKLCFGHFSRSEGNNGLYTGSDSNCSASADIINQNNTNEPAQNPSKCISNNINTPSPTWNCGSYIKTRQNITIERIYNHRTSSSPILIVTEKITIQRQ